MLKKRIKRLFPLPLAAYLVAFFGVSLLLFALVGTWMLVQMGKVAQTAEASRQQSADQEIREAVSLVLDAELKLGAELASWDETHQQLFDDTYYEYWRNTRTLQGSRIPHFVTDVDIYDANGKILLIRKNALMPEQRPQTKSFLRVEGGQPYLYQFTEVEQGADRPNPIGYLGLRIDFTHALLDLNRFVYADNDTIRFTAEQDGTIPLEAIPQYLSVKPRAIGDTRELEEVMLHTLYSFTALAVVLMVTSFFLASSLLHTPLRSLALYIQELRRGNTDVGLERGNTALCVREFDVLRSSIVDYQYELEQMHTHLDQKNKELWRLAHHDALTGVANRRAYDEDWMRLQDLVRGQRITVSVMLIDCDHFKAINDTYGHDIGDKVIRVIADCLKVSLRQGDHLYRLGGDEFAVHLINTDLHACRQLAERCQEQLRKFDFRVLSIKEPVRFSIGIASAEGRDPAALAKLHKQADIAMYRAKRPNNNKTVIYHEGMASNGEAQLSNRYISAVYRAIEQAQGIELHFQPVVAVDNPTPEDGFYETLVRLRDERGLIMPANIFPVVESEGLAVEFDYAVFRRIALELERGVIPQGTCISLNVDGSTLMHNDFIQQVSQLKPYITPGCRCIILEITETALISEIEEGSRKLSSLRDAGFTIALDDFGSGYSSLRYLANMPVDIIKLDIGMIRDLEGQPSQRIITEHIARMINDAGYQLVAEGIETEALLRRVIALGISHVQGYLFNHPQQAIDPTDILTVDRYPRDKGNRLLEAHV